MLRQTLTSILRYYDISAVITDADCSLTVLFFSLHILNGEKEAVFCFYGFGGPVVPTAPEGVEFVSFGTILRQYHMACLKEAD